MNKKKWKQKFAYRDSRRWLKKHEPHYSALHGKPREYADVRDILYEYPALESEYRLYKHQQARHVNRGKRLEDVLEPPRSYHWRGMMAVREAKVITVHRMRHGHTAMKLLNLIYWPPPGKAPMKLADAARALGLTWNRATTMHDGFLRLVEERYNLRKGEVW